MENSWDSNVWGSILLFAVLLGSLLLGNVLKKSFACLRNSLIPTSVLGGTVLIVFAAIYKAITGNIFFDIQLFGGEGTATLEVITYHTLALGFIASAFKSSEGKLPKKRTTEIFNTGVTTVSTYLLQAIIGMGTKINPTITSLSTFVLLAVAPLNLIKGVMISVLTILLYKKVARPLFGIRQ